MEGSFSTNLVGSFSQIKLKSFEEATLLNEMSNFFVLYYDEYSIHFQKLETIFSPLKKVIETRQTIDSVSTFILNFYHYFHQYLLDQSNFIKNTFNQIKAKFQEFSESYSKIVKSINNKMDDLFHEYNEYELKVVKLKGEYDELRLNFCDISTLRKAKSFVIESTSLKGMEEKSESEIVTNSIIT